MHVIRSEFTKFLSLRGVWIITAITTGLFLRVQTTLHGQHVAMIDVIRPDGTADIGFGVSPVIDEIQHSIGTAALNAGLLLPALGAVLAGLEFKPGQLGLSLVAVPNRARFVVGKLLAITLFTVGVALVFIVVALFLIHLAVHDRHLDATWLLPMAQESARVILFMVTTVLLGAGLTLIARRALAGIIIATVLTTLTMLQVVANVSPAADAWLPISAARNLLLLETNITVPLTGSQWHGAVVLTLWATLSWVVALVLLRRRDAR